MPNNSNRLADSDLDPPNDCLDIAGPAIQQASRRLDREGIVTIAARWLLPIDQPPIHSGWVSLRGTVLQTALIDDVGSCDPPGEVIDLGDVALLPGLVNAHTHLEFSDLDAPVGQPGIELASWIGMVVGARNAVVPESKVNAITQGIEESVDAGVRVIGEIATLPLDYDAALRAANAEATSVVDIVAFAEVLGLSPQRSDERFRQATSAFRRSGQSSGISFGVSPHAPYSTSIDTIRNCVELAKRHKRPLAMHVAESPAERELLSAGTGPFAESLKRIGVWSDALFPWSESVTGSDPIAWLIKTLAAAPSSLIIHGNDLTETEMDLIAMHGNLTVVYCPRTHAFFGHKTHPVAKLLRRGVRVALGTDSRASNPDLNLWSEVQFLLNHRQDLVPDDVLRMATLSGALALCHQHSGSITAGKRPGLNLLPTTASTLQQLHEDFAVHPLHPV